jgi:MoaA/NifB/PqqE/SkfB family radical SAM enzyme
MNLLKRLQRTLEMGNTVATDTPFDAIAPFAEHRQARNLPSKSPLCLAPWSSINFTISGQANVCCLNQKTSLNVKDHTVMEIWESALFQTLRDRVTGEDLAYDCSVCLHSIGAGNHTGVKALDYDSYGPTSGHWPKVIEFCLENTCNLACVMCNSVLSSTIRKRQGLPAYKSPYGEEFIHQLDPFLPHLQRVVFSGGEPFLIPFYYRMWERAILLNPELEICVVTNGTMLNDKVKAILAKGKFRINVSIDSVNKEVYESIRLNSDFESVLANFLWFKEYGIATGRPVNIPVCPLMNNWHTIPETVRFANRHGVSINFVYVDRPISLSLVNKPPTILQPVIQQFSTERFEQDSSQAQVNVRRFEGLLSDLRQWYDNNSASRPQPLSEPQEDDSVREHLRKLIDTCDDVVILDDSAIKEELLEKLSAVVSQAPEEQRSAILDKLGSTPMTITYNFVSKKPMAELVISLREYFG